MDELKDIITFFNELRLSSGAIWMENGKIKFSAPKKFQNKVTNDFIINNKAQIIAMLEQNQVSSDRKFLGLKIFLNSSATHYPLSPAQERLWFIDQYEEGTNAYHIHAVYELSDTTDKDAVKHALQQVVGRHEVFRSTIEQDDTLGTVVQKVHDQPLSIEEITLTDKDDYDSLIKEDINKIFDLSRMYPIRVKFYTIVSWEDDSIKRILLLVNKHHIVTDGWSEDLFQRELFLYYDAYLNKNTFFNLPALKIQYKDYALWQRSYLTGETLEKQLSYWKNKLANYQPLEFPTDYQRPNRFDYKGAHHNFVFDKVISQQLRDLSQRYGATLQSTMLSCLHILLSKYTGQDDIITGSITANRNHQQTEELIGFFINTQGNRTLLNRSQSYKDLVQLVHQDQIEAQLHQDLPFEKLVDELKIERDPSRHPLFQILFGVQSFGNEGKNTEKKTYLKPYLVENAYEISRFDLIIFIDDSEEELTGEINYGTRLFHKDTIKKLAHHYGALVEQLLQSPEIPYSQIRLKINENEKSFTEYFEKTGLKHLVKSENEINCTEHQKRLWFIDNFEKNYLYENSPVYHNLPLIIELSESANITKLNLVINELLDQCSFLRTNISTNDGVPLQKINKSESQEVRKEKLLNESDDLPEVFLEIINQPFDIEKNLLIRFNIVEHNKKMFFIIVAHHLLLDRKSLRLVACSILKNLQAEYFDFSSINSIPYLLYAEWQKLHVKNNFYSASVYWKRKLKDTSVFYFETDKPRDPIHIYESGLIKTKLSLSLTKKIEAFCTKFNSSPEALFLAVYKTLLFKLTGTNEIIIGTLYENRADQIRENILGPLSSLLSLKTNLDNEDFFKDYLIKMSSELEETYRYSDYPFEKAVMDVNPAKDMSRTAIFDLLFQFEKNEFDQENLLNEVELNYGLGKYDLNLLVKKEVEYGLYLTYNIRFFENGRIEKFLDQYVNILEGIINDPVVRIKEIKYLSEIEEQELLDSCNSSSVNYPKEETLITLFEEQVSLWPENIALVFNDQCITYDELNRRANQLAVYLKESFHIIPNDLIAVKLDRGIEMIISILGILKSGGAYVPIDPEYPQDRIDYIINDCNCKALINSDEYEKFLRVANEYSIENVQIENKPSDLAYVIYTSGSTGKPKGVLIEHMNVVRLFKTDSPLFDFGSDDVWTMFHSYCFDFSVWEMYGALLFGGKLILLPSRFTKDPNLYLDLLKEHKVTVLNQTPSSFYNIIPQELEKKDADLCCRYVIFGGEALSPGRLKEWKERYPETQLINMYGITETTVHVTFKKITDAEIANNVSNIGKAIPTLSCYVFDQNKQLLPIGSSGELYVGGLGVARGYLNRIELTSERFVINPYNKEEKLYRSGDIVKRLKNGELEYIGRIDDQVKIRGFRIELGEIENVLNQISGIKECCIIAKERKTDEGITKYLVAYYVLSEKNLEVDRSVIHDKLKQILPEYMVPAALVQLKFFPLTVNGKLDKRALPDPEFGSTSERYVSPTNEVEQSLCNIWQTVLGIDKVSINDNFFRIGGDSILSIQVSSRIRQAGFVCQVKDIFEHKTIARLAEQIVKKDSKVSFKTEQGILSGESGLLPVQKWFLDKVNEGVFEKFSHLNHSFLVKVPKINTNKLIAIVEQLVNYHDVLRMKYVKVQESETNRIQWKQVYQSKIVLPEIKTLDVSKHDKAEIQEILTSWQNNFDLEQGFLFQIGYLYGYKDGSARLFFALHHLIVDGVSWRILAEDVKSLYEGRALQSKGSSYRQWVECLSAYPQLHLTEETYWEQLVKGLPTYQIGDIAAEPHQESFELDKELTTFLLQNASKVYHTEINDLLLTALAFALKEINKNDIQGITLEGHGRESIDSFIDHSHTIGWFTSLFPVKLEVKSSLKESIQSVKESLRGIPNKGIGFGAFANTMSTNYSYKDLPPISFNYLGQFASQLDDWHITSEDSGSSICTTNKDHNIFNINGMVSNGKLEFIIVSSLGKDMAKLLSDCYKAQIIRIIEHCNEKIENKESSYTPSDFKLAKVSQSLLDKLQLKAKSI